jgi:hypothetical protein
MKCQRCGAESVVIRQQFCHRCGGSLISSESSLSPEITSVGTPLLGIGVTPYEVTKTIKMMMARERGEQKDESYNRQLVERIIEASKQSEDDIKQTPAVALTTNRLASIQTFLVQAQFYFQEGDIEAAFGRLDGAWRMLPTAVKQKFPVRPSLILADLISRPHDAELMLTRDIFGYSALQNSKLRRQAEEDRLVRIATEVFDEIAPAYWAELERQGYDLPKSGRFSLEKAIAAAHEADEALEQDNSA